MGYVREKIYNLVFEDPELAGLEIKTRSTSVGQFMDISKLMDAAGTDLATDIDKMTALLRLFADGALISWNLEHVDGTPVPADFEGLYAQDLDFVLEVISAWMNAVATLPGPKEPSSNGGVPSVEASLPMEALSPNRSS